MIARNIGLVMIVLLMVGYAFDVLTAIMTLNEQIPVFGRPETALYAFGITFQALTFVVLMWGAKEGPRQLLGIGGVIVTLVAGALRYPSIAEGFVMTASYIVPQILLAIASGAVLGLMHHLFLLPNRQ